MCPEHVNSQLEMNGKYSCGFCGSSLHSKKPWDKIGKGDIFGNGSQHVFFWLLVKSGMVHASTVKRNERGSFPSVPKKEEMGWIRGAG
jgi:hypothetical protein